MIRVPRLVTAAAAAVIALAVGAPGPAHASPGSVPVRPSAASPPPAPPGGSDERLPEGWEISGTGAGRELVWHAAAPVPPGDARVEFHAGHRLLGVPVAGADRRTFRLRLGGARVGAAAGLQVRAGGRRLDAAGSAPQARRPAAPVRPAPALPPNPVDPGLPGPYRTVGGEYELPSEPLAGYPEPLEMRAAVVGPADAPGRRPLALFLHGRHSSCYTPEGHRAREARESEWPCAPGDREVPSYRGYLHDQRLLASQGYVTVSISANAVNAQDYLDEDGGAQARSSLVRLHLARWARWAADRDSAPAAVRAVARADLSRVLLVGHSRGGEGVDRAALDSLSRPPAGQDGYHGPVRWRIRGTVLIGPTLFGQNPAPDVPSVTILPGCDGDVSDLQGELYLDGTRGVSRGAALHSAVYMTGANHNFFNSEWTPGQAQAPAEDDFQTGDTPDAVCTPGTKTRLTAAQQQAAGSTYIAAAARLFVAGDDRVLPLLDGSGRRAPSADPARVLTHAVGGGRTPVVVPDDSVAVTGGRLCGQVDRDPATACLPPDGTQASPHFTAWEPAPEPGRYAVATHWTRAGSPVRIRPARPVSVAGARELALRVIVPPNTAGTRLDVALTDASGHRAALGEARVDGLPGTERTTSYWAREVRVPLSAATRAGLDLRHVTALELTPRSRSGRAWLMDAWGWRPGVPAVRPAALPRIDIGRQTVEEGDSGTRTHHVPVHVTGPGHGQVRIFLSAPDADQATSRVVTVGPGHHDIDVPIEVRGNTRYGYDASYDVFAKAVRGTVVGSYHGGLTVKEDDPVPTARVTPVADRVTEGQSLTWRVTLSETADTDVQAGFAFLPAGQGPELSTTDVDSTWLRDVFGEEPTPARPLSAVGEEPTLWFAVPAGARTVDVSVPTVRDRVSEPPESLRLRPLVYDWSGQPHPGPEFTGTVRDAA
ncbi:hypothetical protein RKE29_02510 [Streptomyces sp. B1866]|uniref:hypothetical protein n=1 Tax=Streptomyces sp. B1866 TaxID=3075431 RepID=UPI00288D8526|nr:hypothetical protein [Streptomyces sp. B1866]MDT3395530.1 hypothetical protein [Streptomyces sp. B1866]